MNFSHGLPMYGRRLHACSSICSLARSPPLKGHYRLETLARHRLVRRLRLHRRRAPRSVFSSLACIAVNKVFSTALGIGIGRSALTGLELSVSDEMSAAAAAVASKLRIALLARLLTSRQTDGRGGRDRTCHASWR